MTTAQRTNRSRTPVRNALALCSMLANGAAPARLVDLAERTAMLPSTAQRSLAELIEAGWVLRRGDQYFLGPALLALSVSPLRHPSLAQLSIPVLDRLADLTDGIVNLQVLDADATYVAAEVHSLRYARVRTYEGERIPAHRTVGGVVMVAALDAELRQHYLAVAGQLDGNAARREFEAALAMAETDTHYYSANVLEPLFAGLAVPITGNNHAGHGALAAVAVGPELADADNRTRILRLLQAGAAAIAEAIDNPGVDPVLLLRRTAGSDSKRH